jgi:hypothetical protein
MAQQTPVGQGHLISDNLWLYSDTPHMVGLLWMSDQPGAENSAWQHTTLTADRHSRPQRDSNPQSQQSERPQTLALDRAATGIDNKY